MTRATTTTDKTAMATFEASSVPNQMMTIGASAMIGIEPTPTTNGWTTRATKREYQRDRPTTVPITLPSTNPTSVSSAVTEVSRTRLPSRHIWTRNAQMADGEPKRKAESASLAVLHS